MRARERGKDTTHPSSLQRWEDRGKGRAPGVCAAGPRPRGLLGAGGAARCRRSAAPRFPAEREEVSVPTAEGAQGESQERDLGRGDGW